MSHHEVVAHVAPRTTREVLRRRQGAKLAGKEKKKKKASVHFECERRKDRLSCFVLLKGSHLTEHFLCNLYRMDTTDKSKMFDKTSILCVRRCDYPMFIQNDTIYTTKLELQRCTLCQRIQAICRCAAWSAEKKRGRAASWKHLLMYIIDEELQKVGRERDTRLTFFVEQLPSFPAMLTHPPWGAAPDGVEQLPSWCYLLCGVWCVPPRCCQTRD